MQIPVREPAERCYTDSKGSLKASETGEIDKYSAPRFRPNIATLPMPVPAFNRRACPPNNFIEVMLSNHVIVVIGNTARAFANTVRLCDGVCRDLVWKAAEMVPDNVVRSMRGGV
jgi:hypothetical protein